MIDQKEEKHHAFESISNFVRRSFRRSGRRSNSVCSNDGRPVKPMMPSCNFVVEYDDDMGILTGLSYTVAL